MYIILLILLNQNLKYKIKINKYSNFYFGYSNKNMSDSFDDAPNIELPKINKKESRNRVIPPPSTKSNKRSDTSTPRAGHYTREADF